MMLFQVKVKGVHVLQMHFGMEQKLIDTQVNTRKNIYKKMNQ